MPPIHGVLMRLAVLSGGTGTPKLLWGMREVLPDEDVSVVVNTAEDLWISGNHISPDVDTVMYLYAGILNTATWWGIMGDTFCTHELLQRCGSKEYIAVGDQDRAIHILRGDMLRSGVSLTECTRILCEQFGARAT
ncbi:MAG: 2-phospho-L-lactate transferase CofD family protein, partial [Methanomicrobiales archaeon]|nr:2-phospho-L-lactate transferase CofD family protein [Methanomicrobiales archaeon]